MATSDMWYIDEGFLVWIIPLTYQSRKSIIWAFITSFIHLIFIACLMYLSHVYVYLCSKHRFLWIFSDSYLSIYMYLLHSGFTIVPLIFFMLPVIVCTCMPKPHHLIMYTCYCLSTPTGFIICTRRGFLTTLDPHVQILEFGPWWPYCTWSEWRSGSMN